MQLHRFLNNKSVSVLAGIVALGYLIGELSMTEIVLGVAWLIGAIFTWRTYLWAILLLTLLAVYNLIFDIILEIPNFEASISDLSADTNLEEPIVRTLGVIVISFETFVVLCVICFGIVVFMERLKKAR